MYFQVTVKSKYLMRATDVHVFLPFGDGYPGAEEPFKTLYFLPGYSANASELAFCFAWRQLVAESGIAVIIPDGENSFYSDHSERAVENGRFVAEELIEITRRMFPQLSHKREDTFIGGISMGGYGAATLGLNHTETFSKIALFSPSIEADHLLKVATDVEGSVPSTLYGELLNGDAGYHTVRYDPLLAVDHLLAEGKEIPHMFLCCGEQDVLVGDACRDFVQRMQQKQVPIETHWGDGIHDLVYWDRMLPAGFRFLLG